MMKRVKSVMLSPSGTPYIDLSFMGTVSSNNIKDFSGVNVSLTSTIPNLSNPSQPIIQSHFTLTCAPGRDCSSYFEKLEEINQPRLYWAPIDGNGNIIGEEKVLELDPNDLIPNQREEKYIPVIDSLNKTEIQEGGGAFNLTAYGSMFNPLSTIFWNDLELNTAYKDYMTLTALVPAHYTTLSKKVKIKVRKIIDRNGKTYYSEGKDFEVKSKLEKYFAFDTKADFEKEIPGNNSTLNRSGGNVYIDENTTVFKEAGEVIIPFTVSSLSNLNVEVIGSLTSTNSEPTIEFYHNNHLIYTLLKTLRFRTYTEITNNKKWTVNLTKLSPGMHTVKLSLPDLYGETIFVLDRIKFSFTRDVKPMITSDTSKAELKVLSNNVTYNFSPDGPSASLKVTLNTEGLPDKAIVGVFDKAGKVTAQGSFKPLFNEPDKFDVSFVLPYDLKEGDYHVLSVLERKNSFSDSNTKDLFDDLIQNNIKTEDELNSRLINIPDSHHKIFMIGTNVVPVINLSGVYTKENSSFIQEGQEVTASVDLKGNVTDTSNLKVIVDFGDGSEDVTAKHVYKLPTNTKNQFFEITAKVFLNGAEIGSNQTGLTVYKDLPPVAVAIIDTENFEYQGDAPFMSGFIDKSYDPNEEVSASDNSKKLDSTVPEKNIWKLFKYKDSISNQITNTEDLSVLGNQVLNQGKTFLTGNILNPGTYFAKLTVFDENNNSDSTQSETVQVTLPSQKLLVHASFENVIARSVEDATKQSPTVFEYDSEGKVKVQFNSIVQIRGSKQPKNIIYHWDFGEFSNDDFRFPNQEQQLETPNSKLETNQPNPTHTYKQSSTNHDKIDYHPELTVTAIWANGYSETWSSKAGTVSIIDRPEFVALDLVLDTTIGNIPLTVNFMVSDKSFAKNATISSYEFDFGDNSEPATGRTGDTAIPEAALNELKQKTFTHTYNTRGDFSPALKVKIKENPTKEITFNSPIISTNSLLVSGIEVVEPLDNFITNQPIQTFKINTQYSNPFSEKNRLTIHVTGEENNETVTELNSNSDTQTLSLSEGINSYWFELVDSSGAVEKSLMRKVVLDTQESAISNVSTTIDLINGALIIKGNLVEKNFQKIEIVLDDQIPLILSSGDLIPIDSENDEYSFSKTFENISDSYHTILLRAYDLAGNIGEAAFELNKQKNSLIPTLERSEITNNFQNNFKSPETIVNYPEHIYGSHEIKRTVISGEPFELGLKTCFSDDVSLSDSRNVSANFEINSHKVEVSKDSSDFKDITNNIDDLISGYINRCIDIQSYGVQYKKLNCTDSSADTYHCKDACTILDGHICNVNIFSTGKELNKYQSYSSLFNPAKDILDITKGWDVGHYDLRLTINENQDSCFTYGTCLGKNPNEQITSETYTYSIDVIREPNISYPDSQNLKLLYDKDNEITFKFIAKDNLPFNLSSNRVPEVGTPVWSSIEEDFTPEEITILSKSIDPNDPRNYIVELKTNIHPKSLNKLNLKIPVIFPSDYFNSEGIQKEASFTFNILANLQAEIVSPSLGTLLGGNKTLLVTSKVKKPEDLTNEFPDFNNCAKSTINFQIETVNKEVKTLEIISPKGKAEKIESKGVDEPGGRIFKNNLNFNLKNIFRKDFLSGNIFGPIKLYGEYSTFCNTKNITFDGDPKTYILLDNPRIIKGNCKYPSGANYSKCEFTISNNTLLDVANGLQLEVIPNLGTIDPACSATFPQVTFEKENKLTKKVKVDCLPKEATSIEIKLKRNPGFLNEIEKKLTGTGLTTANNQEAIVADRKSFEVKNAPQEEENTLLKVGDSNDKSVTVDGKEISVGNLNKLLFDLGYLANENEQGYTTNTRDAFARLICDYRAQETNLSNIRFLTLYGSCQENDYSNFKTKEEEVKIATVIQDFMRGILISNTELYHAIKTNPVLATFVIGFAVTAGVVITVGSAGTDAYIAGVLAQLGAVGVMTQIEDIKNKLAGYFNESNSFKAGYVFGEAGKLVGLAVVIGFASKGLTNLSYTIQGVKQAQILSEQGYKDLANAIYEQVSKINNAADDLKIGMKKGLDGVLKTVDDIQTGEIFKDFQRLWPEVTQEEISSIKLSALKLFNDIVAKMQQQEELFKIYETDPGGYETKVLEHALIDKRFQSILQSPGKDLAETVKNAISEKVNGTVSSLNQYFANKGLLLIGDVISQDTVPPRLSTFMKISDFKKYNLKGTKYEDAKDEVIIADIKSGVLNPSIIKGELSTRSGIRWWTDTSKIDELRTSGILTKEYITGDNGVALDYNPLDSLETHIEIIISKENIDFYVPVSSAGGRKFVPSPNNPDLHNGKSLGGLYEIYSNKVPADITSGHVTGIDVVE